MGQQKKTTKVLTHKKKNWIIISERRTGVDERELTKAQVELKSTTKEVKQVKVELESTRKELIEVKAELESTRNEVTQVKVDLEWTSNALNKVKVELDTTSEQINILRKEMIEKDNTCRKETNQNRVDVGAVREELNKLKKEDKLHAQIMQNHREVGRNYGYSIGVSGTINVVISCMEEIQFLCVTCQDKALKKSMVEDIQHFLDS
ncbi:unnamed protein product [Mytilus edulis]|uniref:Uncharacterized protein n=1 Tax=Mytilus edulis TaxID=6550 RepID=A0A8S3QX56_MYTED|nr:unnamed protein product [Mytilus edulis]